MKIGLTVYLNLQSNRTWKKEGIQVGGKRTKAEEASEKKAVISFFVGTCNFLYGRERECWGHCLGQTLIYVNS